MSARSGTAGLHTLAKVQMLNFAKVCRVEIAGDRTRYEPHPLLFVAREQDRPRGHDLMPKERRRLRQVNQIHGPSRCRFERCYNAVEHVGRLLRCQKNGYV